VILLTLGVVTGAIYRLNQLATDWHYVLPAEPGDLLYVASFDGDAEDWEQYPGNQVSVQVVDDALRIAIHKQDKDGIYSPVSHYFGEFDITVQAQPLQGVFSGADNNAYGIIFRQRDRSNYYLFLISGDGYYRIQRILNGRNKDMSGWTSSDSINQGTNVINTLRVVGYQDQFQFFVNGDQLELCIPDDSDAESTPSETGACVGGEWRDTLIDDTISFGRLGVTVNSDNSWPDRIVVDFDNVIVYGPEPITSD
jgi:hypothetical protein